MGTTTRNRTPVITTTIAEPLLHWLTKESERTRRTRRDILEEALLSYKRGQYRASLQLMAQDKEAMAESREMAEWGMADYAEQLRKMDEEKV